MKLSFVQTEMGNAGARAFGMEQAPVTIEESVTKTIATVSPIKSRGLGSE